MKNVFFLLLCFVVLQTAAQRTSKIEPDGARFMTGDKMEWSNPSFDDSKWPLIKTNNNWEPQGYEGYNGFAWYRIHFALSSSLKNNAYWKDSVRIFLAKIDDADEIFLNGKLIAKNGSFPSDPNGYQTEWDKWREIHLAANDPVLKWDQENIIAIRVYDGDGAGGMFAADPFINMMDIIDGIKMKLASADHNGQQLELENVFSLPIEGMVQVVVVNSASTTLYSNLVKKISLKANEKISIPLKTVSNIRQDIEAVFSAKNTNAVISLRKVNDYILTPKASPLPRINNAAAFGVRPNSPFLFKIAATGAKPLQYSATNLPTGLTLNTTNGVITGSITNKGEYKIQLIVKNKLGTAKKELLVKCGDLLALTPPMGWNSWNCWGLSVSDTKLKSSAQAMIDKGLIDHGWTYMNIDDGWEAPKRNEKGEIVTNEKFPNMKSLGDWLHRHGLKFGIYSSPGTLTCGGYLGSYEHELEDAQSYNSWGIDYLKYDWCSYGRIHDKNDSSVASYKKPYEVMQAALRAQPRDIVYSLCQYGMKDVWKWGHEVDGNCWRTTGDIEDSWPSLRNIGFSQDKAAPYAKPGRWNDPDMLIVGQVGWGEHLHPTRLTADEQYTHISLWCLLSAPLLIGCDISKMDDFTLNLLTNDEVIAIDQDVLGKSARQVISNNNYQVWVKELSDGNKAIGIFNMTEEYRYINLDWKEIQLNGTYRVRDLWRQKDLGTFTSFETKVPPHGVTLIKISR